MVDDTPNSGSTPPGDRPARRPRYSGKNPRRYDERYKELDPARFPDIHRHVAAQGRTPAGTHVPVLLDEVMECLRPGDGDVVADCTIGYGGHAEHFLKRIGPAGRLIGLDLDRAQLTRTRERLAELGLAAVGPSESEPAHASLCGDDVPLVVLERMHFAGIAKMMARLGLDGFDVILADLGVSSMQLDDPARGFGYKHDGPLDMRMDDRSAVTAASLLESMSEAELSQALHELGDEPDHAAIARAIARQRTNPPITRTSQLVQLIFQAKGISRAAWRKRGEEQTGADTDLPRVHPAALTFQALRILVNDELAGLAQFLRIVPHCLRPGGRCGIISFHSGEDRLVKKAFREGLEGGVYDAIADEPIRPSPEERRSNPRSRSAKLRWARRSVQ